MASGNDEMMDIGGAELDNNKNEKMFTLKKWNAVAMWSWDVECDTCAICRVQVMGKQFHFHPPFIIQLNDCVSSRLRNVKKVKRKHEK